MSVLAVPSPRVADQEMQEPQEEIPASRTHIFGGADIANEETLPLPSDFASMTAHLKGFMQVGMNGMSIQISRDISTQIKDEVRPLREDLKLVISKVEAQERETKAIRTSLTEEVAAREEDKRIADERHTNIQNDMDEIRSRIDNLATSDSKEKTYLYRPEFGAAISKRWGRPDILWVKGVPKEWDKAEKEKVMDAILSKFKVPQPTGYPYVTYSNRMPMISVQCLTVGATDKLFSLLDSAALGNDIVMTVNGKKLRPQMDEDIELRGRRRAANAVRTACNALFMRGELPKALCSDKFAGAITFMAPEMDEISVKAKGEHYNENIVVAKEIEGHPGPRLKVSKSGLLRLGSAVSEQEFVREVKSVFSAPPGTMPLAMIAGDMGAKETVKDKPPAIDNETGVSQGASSSEQKGKPAETGMKAE